MSMKNKNILKPNISDYLDYRKFMVDYYNYKKKTTPDFSHTVWTNLAGFKSRSFLRLVMLGKRSISADSILLVARSLELNKQDTDFFYNLVSFNQSDNFKNREFYLNKLMKTNVAKKLNTIKDSYRYLNNHITPRVQIALMIPFLDKTPEKIAQLLNANIAQVNQSLTSLKSLGLADYDTKSEQWSTISEKLFSLPDDFGNVAIQSFHQKSLNEAITAITQINQSRNFSSLLLVLNDDEYQSLLKDYKDFEKTIIAKYGITDGLNKRIYQINKNFIPVSDTLIEDDQLTKVQTSQTDLVPEESP